MKDLREVYADQFTSDWPYFGPYSDLIDSFEHEVLLEKHDDDYQGDSRYILRDGARYGLLVFGWGSCSGCDALEACGNIQQVIDLRDTLYNSIEWHESPAALLKFIKERDWELQYAWHQDETQEFVNSATRLLEQLVSKEGGE